jgi:hypothetical protein
VQGKILFAGGKHEVVRHITFDWTPHDAGDGAGKKGRWKAGRGGGCGIHHGHGRGNRYDQRTVALKGPRGNIVVLKVGPDVKNFKQIKTGDRVTTKYFEHTAFDVRKPDEPLFAKEALTVQAAAAGEKAGGAAVDTVEMKTRAKDIDRLGFPDFHRGNS